MSSELAQRRTFAVIQFIVGLVVPAIFFTGLTTFSFASAAYWFGLPAASFLTLAWLSLARRGGQFRVSRSGMVAAAIAGYLAFLVPVIFLWFTTGAYYRGGGANIGVALLMAAMPVYLPVVMVMGFAFGEYLHSKRRAP